MHWSTVYRRTRRLERDVGFAVRAAGKPHAPLELARVVLTRCSASEPDPDNLAASFKPVVDALVAAGVLSGDEPHRFEGRRPEYRWEPAPRHQGRVRVEVEEREPGSEPRATRSEPHAR